MSLRQGNIFTKRYSYVPVSEEEVQKAIVRALETLGYRVMVTTVRYRFAPCPKCGYRHRPSGGTGMTPGVPDLLVSRDNYPPRCWLGLEVKKSRGGELSEFQKRLLDLGRIAVVRSVEEALAVCREFEERLGIAA